MGEFFATMRFLHPPTFRSCNLDASRQKMGLRRGAGRTESVIYNMNLEQENSHTTRLELNSMCIHMLHVVHFYVGFRRTMSMR